MKQTVLVKKHLHLDITGFGMGTWFTAFTWKECDCATCCFDFDLPKILILK